MIDLLKNQNPTSESRFDGLKDKQQAIAEFISSTRQFIDRHSLICENAKNNMLGVALPRGSIFKYGDQLPSFLKALDDGEDVTVVFVRRAGEIVAIGMAEVPESGSVKVETIDVESKSRRSNGLKHSIEIEGQVFDIGIAHALVLMLVDTLRATRIHTDATNKMSRYVFKSLGFSPYTDKNSCLLEFYHPDMA